MAGELTQRGAERAIQAGLGQSVSAAAGMYIALATATPANPDTADLAAWGSAAGESVRFPAGNLTMTLD